MRQMSLDRFIAHLQGVNAALPRAERRGLHRGAEIIQHEAQHRIGRENNEWPPLAERTVAEKARLGYTGRISATDPLYRTGELRASIEVSVDGHRAVVGTHDKVALFQEMGTSRIPARSFLGSAAYVKGREAANAIGAEVAHAIAGKVLTRD